VVDDSNKMASYKEVKIQVTKAQVTSFKMELTQEDPFNQSSQSTQEVPSSQYNQLWTQAVQWYLLMIKVRRTKGTNKTYQLLALLIHKYL